MEEVGQVKKKSNRSYQRDLQGTGLVRSLAQGRRQRRYLDVGDSLTQHVPHPGHQVVGLLLRQTFRSYTKGEDT